MQNELIFELENPSEKCARMDQLNEEILQVAHELMETREVSTEVHHLISRLEHLLTEVDTLSRR